MITPVSKPAISAVLIVRDAERVLERCLASLAAFDDVVLYDNGSADETLAIARRFANVRVASGAFDGFGPTRNSAAALARNDWILPVDADEWLTPELTQALLALRPEGDRSVYAFWRRNLFLGHRMNSRLGREWIRRLYHRRFVRFEGRVHESFHTLDGSPIEVRPLAGEIMHDPYGSIGHLFQKRWLYAQPDLRGELRGAHPFMATLHAAWRFLRCYLLYGGLIDGWRGFVLSVAEAYGTFLKYVWNYASRRQP